jgi:hypothetical protein
MLAESWQKGIDLAGNEVKSSENGGAFEYQYHKNTGRQKVKDDIEAGHLFFSHRDNLRFVELRYIHGHDLSKEFFEPWLRDFPTPYQQRYRKSISFGWVEEHGTLLMRLNDGEITYPKL